MKTLAAGVVFFFVTLVFDAFIVSKLTGKGLFEIPFKTLIFLNFVTFATLLFLYVLIIRKKI